jgi:hypothetical protein
MSTIYLKESINNETHHSYFNYDYETNNTNKNKKEVNECKLTCEFIVDYLTNKLKDNYKFEVTHIDLSEPFEDYFKRLKESLPTQDKIVGACVNNPGFMHFYLKRYKHLCIKNNYSYSIYEWIKMMNDYREEFKKDMETPNIIHQFGENYFEHLNREKEFNESISNMEPSNYKVISERIYHECIDMIEKSGGKKLLEKRMSFTVMIEMLAFPIEPLDENLPHKEFMKQKKGPEWKHRIAVALDKAKEFNYCTDELVEYTKKLIMIKDVSDVETIGTVLEWAYWPAVCPFANEDGTTENDELPNYKKREF